MALLCLLACYFISELFNGIVNIIFAQAGYNLYSKYMYIYRQYYVNSEFTIREFTVQDDIDITATLEI